MSVYRKYCCSECAEIARRKNLAENNREYYAQNRDTIIQRVKAARAKHNQE